MRPSEELRRERQQQLQAAAAAVGMSSTVLVKLRDRVSHGRGSQAAQK